MLRKITQIVCLLTLALSSLLLHAPTAEAAFLGGNGKLLYRTSVDNWSSRYETRNADGSGQIQFSPTSDTSGGSWSPDGSLIAFSKGRDIHLMDSNGANVRQLTSSIEDRGSADPQWSPDGTTILFRNCMLLTAVCGLNVLSTDGSYNEELIPYDYNSDIREAKWSPDGKNIVLSIELNHDSSTRHLYLVSLETGEINQLTADDAVYFSPSWSPDGTKLVFIKSIQDTGPYTYDLYTLDIESSAISPIATNSDHEYGVVWSPDGTKLFINRASTAPGSDANIYSHKIDDATETLIASDASLYDVQPIASPFIYRLANWMTQERLFTTNPAEVYSALLNSEGWVYEGIGLRSYRQSDANTVPVYRLANWQTQERLFTTSFAEVQYAQTLPGWVYEGVAFYQRSTSTAGASPVYRLANWKTQERLFTSSWDEVQSALSMDGWVYEGTSFYAPNN